MSDSFDGFEVEDNGSVNDSSMLDTWLERSLPPVLTYCLRKLNLAWLRFLKLVMAVSVRPFGQSVQVEIEERDSWKWLEDFEPPLYRARVEKVD